MNTSVAIIMPRKFRFALYGASAALASVVALKYRSDLGDMSVVRMGRAGLTAIEIGYTYKTKLYNLNLDKSSEEYAKMKSCAHQAAAEKLLELCRANKGVFIKVGQHVGALEYLLPNEYVRTMRVLHKDAPQNSVEELYQVIREDLKQEPKEIFCEFDPEPLGTASLAQVHRAKLKDGTVVAVKVQHHFVRKNINKDLICMELLINAMAKVFPDFQMDWLVEETKKNIYKELNFLQEGDNAEKVSEMFKDYTWLKVPKILWDYCTERVLVMEYVEGGLVNDVSYIKKNKIDPYDLSTKLGDLYSHMIFVKGFVHSDPHPGNILVKKSPQDKDTTVYLLDHGLYATLTDKFRYHYSKLWLAIIARNRDEMKVHAEELGIRGDLYGLFACMVTGRPWDTIMKGIDRTKPSSIEKTTFQTEVPNFLTHITECLQHVDRQALLVLKTNDLIRSIEYALQTHERMCGFMVMTKCCMQSIYNLEYKEARSTLRRALLNFGYTWSLFTFYVYAIFLHLRSKVVDS